MSCHEEVQLYTTMLSSGGILCLLSKWSHGFHRNRKLVLMEHRGELAGRDSYHGGNKF